MTKEDVKTGMRIGIGCVCTYSSPSPYPIEKKIIYYSYMYLINARILHQNGNGFE